MGEKHSEEMTAQKIEKVQELLGAYTGRVLGRLDRYRKEQKYLFGILILLQIAILLTAILSTRW